MLLVVGQESSQIAEFGASPRSLGASTVAIGAHGRPGREERLVHPFEFGLLERLELAGGLGILGDLFEVLHRNAAG